MCTNSLYVRINSKSKQSHVANKLQVSVNKFQFCARKLQSISLPILSVPPPSPGINIDHYVLFGYLGPLETLWIHCSTIYLLNTLDNYFHLDSTRYPLDTLHH